MARALSMRCEDGTFGVPSFFVMGRLTSPDGGVGLL
jgi:hypothetical protein